VTDTVASVTLLVNHFQGRDDRYEDDVDEHLEQRVEDPPEIAQERIGALLADVRPDQVADQSAPREHVLEGIAEQPERSRPGRCMAELGGHLTGGGHRREG
jgi:hypothetical protein